MMQQAPHSQSSTMDVDHLTSYLRNQLGDAAFCNNMPDAMNSVMAQANWTLNSQNLGSSESNALASQIIMEQLQVPAAQIMRNLQSQTQNTAEMSACSLPLNGTSVTQYSSPTSTLSSLDGFHTLKSEQQNNKLDVMQAWRLYKRGCLPNMIDSTLTETCREEQALRCIHVALLCTQSDAGLRPTISNVISLISSASVTLAIPTKPAFVKSSGSSQGGSTATSGISQSRSSATVSSVSSGTTPLVPSINDVTISELDAR